MTNFDFIAAWLRSRAQSERGASLVEYALLLTFIAVVCITALRFLGDKASDSFDSTGQSLQVGN